MSVKEEFHSMNSWEWLAVGLSLGVIAWFVFSAVPIGGIFFGAAAFFAGIMSIIQRDK